MSDNATPLVSLTMATYNVAEYLERSLDSVVNQTYRNLDIYIVDDGSTDNTPEILRLYAERDSRIRLVLKEKNEGLAVSRNMAVSEARGVYIAFADGDDILDITLVEKAVNRLQEGDYDFVIWDYRVFHHDEELTRLGAVSSLEGVDPHDIDTLLSRPNFAWVKMAKTDFLRSLNTPFPIGRTRQDMPVNWRMLTSGAKIGLVPERLYCYRQQPSATTAFKNRKLFDLVYMFDIIGQNLKTDGLYERYRDRYLMSQLSSMYGVCNNIEPRYETEAMALVGARLGEEQRNYIYTGRLPLRTRAFYKGTFYGSRANKWLHGAIMTARTVYRKVKGVKQ